MQPHPHLVGRNDVQHFLLPLQLLRKNPMEWTGPQASLCAPTWASSATSDHTREKSPAPAAPSQEQTQACPDRSSTHPILPWRWRDETYHYTCQTGVLVTPGRPLANAKGGLHTKVRLQPPISIRPTILGTLPVPTDKRGKTHSKYQHQSPQRFHI